MKQTAVVIFPGRGTYGKTELGYLSRFHSDKTDFLKHIDNWRASAGRIKISDLDSAKAYSAAKHATSENASALIYACALCDFASIDHDKFDVVAICGNSLGWYMSLAAGRALNNQNAIRLIDTMGALMEEHGTGGQLVYPMVGEDWRPSDERQAAIDTALLTGAKAGAAHLSIHLGGTAVLAGDEAGLEAIEKSLPVVEDRYPFRLARHAAFHTPLLRNVSDIAQAMLAAEMFERPSTPLIDGRGAIWSPYSTNIEALYNYTLRHQIVETYSFSKSVEVAIKEFSPDKLILAGPGSTLGAPIAQCLIAHGWKDISSRAEFMDRQKVDPFLLAMGREDQRALVV